MDITKYIPVTIFGIKDILSYLETRNDGNPYKDDEIQRAKTYRVNVPDKVFEDVQDKYTISIACRITTTTDSEGKLHSSITHVYDALLRKSDGRFYIIRSNRQNKRYHLEPLPLETAHGPEFISPLNATVHNYKFEKATERKVESWIDCCEYIRQEKMQELGVQEEKARKFYLRAKEKFGDTIKVLQQTGPNVTKFQLDYGQLRFTYYEEEGTWYRSFVVNPLAVPTNEELFGKSN